MGIKHPIAQWVNNLNINGFTDWYIPSIDELNELYDNVPDLFKKVWYWSSTECTTNARFAWSHYFYNGTSFRSDVYYKERSDYARAVRRLPFNHSTFNIYDECDGGFYAGKYTLDGIDYALIVAPEEQGEAIVQWKVENSATEGADSVIDGLANTQAMLMADKKAEVDCVPNNTNFTLTNEQEIRARKIYNETGGGHDGMLAALEDFKKSLVESNSFFSNKIYGQ